MNLPYFTVDYADTDAGWTRVHHQVRMLYETLAGAGRRWPVVAGQRRPHRRRPAADRDEPHRRGRTRSRHRGHARQADSGRLGAFTGPARRVASE